MILFRVCCVAVLLLSVLQAIAAVNGEAVESSSSSQQQQQLQQQQPSEKNNNNNGGGGEFSYKKSLSSLLAELTAGDTMTEVGDTTEYLGALFKDPVKVQESNPFLAPDRAVRQVYDRIDAARDRFMQFHGELNEVGMDENCARVHRIAQDVLAAHKSYKLISLRIQHFTEVEEQAVAAYIQERLAPISHRVSQQIVKAMLECEQSTEAYAAALAGINLVSARITELRKQLRYNALDCVAMQTIFHEFSMAVTDYHEHASSQLEAMRSQNFMAAEERARIEIAARMAPTEREFYSTFHALWTRFCRLPLDTALGVPVPTIRRFPPPIVTAAGPPAQEDAVDRATATPPSTTAKQGPKSQLKQTVVEFAPVMVKAGRSKKSTVVVHKLAAVVKKAQAAAAVAVKDKNSHNNNNKKAHAEKQQVLKRAASNKKRSGKPINKAASASPRRKLLSFPTTQMLDDAAPAANGAASAAASGTTSISSTSSSGSAASDSSAAAVSDSPAAAVPITFPEAYPRTARLLLFVAMIGTAVCAAIFLWMSMGAQGDAAVHTVVFLFTSISACSYFALYTGVGVSLVGGGVEESAPHVVLWARHLDLLVTLPLSALALSQFARTEAASAVPIMGSSALLAASWFIGAAAPGDGRYAWWVISLIFFLITTVQWISQISAAGTRISAATVGTLQMLTALLVLVWLVYLITFLLGSEGMNLMSFPTEVGLFVFADLVGKLGFGFLLLSSLEETLPIGEKGHLLPTSRYV